MNMLALLTVDLSAPTLRAIVSNRVKQGWDSERRDSIDDQLCYYAFQTLVTRELLSAIRADESTEPVEVAGS